MTESLVLLLIGSVLINILQSKHIQLYKELVEYYKEKSQKHFNWYLEVLDELDNQEKKNN